VVAVNGSSAGSPSWTGSELPSPASAPASSESCLLLVVQQLLQMHQEQLEAVGTLVKQNQVIIDQNQQMLEALNMAIDDVEGGEPTSYLDGTPVKTN
jgi:hypothetical protein